MVEFLMRVWRDLNPSFTIRKKIYWLFNAFFWKIKKKAFKTSALSPSTVSSSSLEETKMSK